MSLFFATIFIILFGGDLLWAVAIRRTFPGGGWQRTLRWIGLAFVALMAFTLAGMMIGRIVGVRVEPFMPRLLAMAVFVWHFIGLGVGLVGGAIFGIGRLTARIATRASSTPPAVAALAEEPASLSRRAFLARATVLAPAIVTAAGTGIGAYELNGFRVRDINVPLANLPSALDGMTIAHLSDVHLGQLTTGATFSKIVAATNDLDADLVLQTGDLINYDQRDLPVAAEMVHAVRGRFGHFMCEGNHDLIQGREPFRQFARGNRMPILINEAAGVTVNGHELCILGLPWTRVPPGQSLDAAHNAIVKQLIAKAPAGSFPILLAHHPHAFDAATANGIPLTLAGHTHGGQLNLTRNFGFGSLMYRYWSGLYQNKGTACVVSNGAGNWFPLRINAPAEILRLTLRRA